MIHVPKYIIITILNKQTTLIKVIIMSKKLQKQIVELNNEIEDIKYSIKINTSKDFIKFLKDQLIIKQAELKALNA